MKKIHTRRKRKYRLSAHINPYYFFHPNLKNRKRPKTFKTEEAANFWALNHGLKPGEYYLQKVKKNKKFQIVVYNGQNKNNTNKKNNP